MASIKDLKSDHKNARKRTDRSAGLIAESLKRFGAARSIVIDEDGRILAGNGTVEGAKAAGISKVRIIETEGDELIAVQRTGLTEEEKVGLALADNRSSDLSEWDNEMLRQLSEEQDLSPWFDEDELTAFANDEIVEEVTDSANNEETARKLSDRFGIAPFTVLNAREGWWQERKRAWLALGIKSEEGREIGSTNVGKNVPDYMAGRGNNEGGSIFDPVLCEIAYRWFCPPKGLVIDPFAGGSIRGVVASKLGRQYIGHELRQEQVDANIKQGMDLCFDDPLPPAWICGDSQNIDKTCADVKADLIFSCPPYANLEVYSDDPKDLSTFTYPEFKSAYFEIIKKSCNLLKDNAFACFVVGEVRDKKGNYYNFVGDTIQAFLAAGLTYYNEAILVTCVGTLPLRAGRTFASTRKLGKTHQNILVFLKGDARKAVAKCGECDFADTDPAAEYGEILEP